MATLVLMQTSRPATVSGIVRQRNEGQGTVAFSKYGVAEGARVTLCSEERIYRTSVNEKGEFIIKAVLSGSYDLVVRRKDLLSPELVRTLHLSTDESVTGIEALVQGVGKPSPCDVSTENHNLLRDYSVDYEPPATTRQAPLVRGRVLKYVTDSAGVFRRFEPLTRADISMSKGDGGVSVLRTKSDRHGSFSFRLEPGRYQLRMRKKGYQEIGVPEFVVPRENVTVIEMKAATANSFTVDR